MGECGVSYPCLVVDTFEKPGDALLPAELRGVWRQYAGVGRVAVEEERGVAPDEGILILPFYFFDIFCDAVGGVNYAVVRLAG